MNKVFLDSNILIYLYTSDEREKKRKITDFINQYDDIYISTQVIFEFCYVAQRKLKLDLDSLEKAIEEFKRAFCVKIITVDMLVTALKIAKKYKYSFPDSLIIATALHEECSILVSEDMHTGHTIDDLLKIVSPF